MESDEVAGFLVDLRWVNRSNLQRFFIVVAMIWKEDLNFVDYNFPGDVVARTDSSSEEKRPKEAELAKAYNLQLKNLR